MDEQGPGHLPDLRTAGNEQPIAEPPRGHLVAAQPRGNAAAEPPGVPAVALPGAQPGAQLVVGARQGPVAPAARRGGGRVDDEPQLATIVPR